MKHGFKTNTTCGVTYLSVPAFDETGLAVTCFSTRLGGVSASPLNEMNLGFGRGDDKSNVIRNYELLGNAAGFDALRTVAFSQIHRNGVCVASDRDAGEAFSCCKREFDAVVSNTPNLPVATYHADCVPIFLLDPKSHAVGVAHAGWRGTAMKTPAAAIREMKKNFGSRPCDILAAIGPSIGACCFETDRDVPDAMLAAFGEEAIRHISSHGNGKYHVSLPSLNVLTLISSGILEDNITVSDECTCCKNHLYWSHRATGGLRGAMAAVIMLKGEK